VNKTKNCENKIRTKHANKAATRQQAKTRARAKACTQTTLLESDVPKHAGTKQMGQNNECKAIYSALGKWGGQGEEGEWRLFVMANKTSLIFSMWPPWP